MQSPAQSPVYQTCGLGGPRSEKEQERGVPRRHRKEPEEPLQPGQCMMNCCEITIRYEAKNNSSNKR
ncbi:hypothetical protein NDU88_002000 [Pleurodeles waltl]|uniref:Uncharacterized protein n=1 Tax=Pleurodeles waltl TaxID=8319 RepID=A0AAV7M165_PLEWA|nr:hypothetical protein NDU88_002000 [Pleurodeles waltl]